MPPANSPTDTPSATRTPPSSTPFLQQLETISTPVLDLAGTLMTHPEPSSSSQARLLRRRRALNEERAPGGHGRSNRIRLMSTNDTPLNGSNDLSALPQMPPRADSAYRFPDRQGLRGGPLLRSVYWPPGGSNDSEAVDYMSSDLVNSPWNSRDSARPTGSTSTPSFDAARDYLARRSVQSLAAYAPTTDEMAGGASHSNHGLGRTGSSRYEPYGDSSLVTAALLQSARRNPRLTSRNLNSSQSQNADNGISGREDLDRDVRLAFEGSQSLGNHQSSTNRELRRPSEGRRVYAKDPSIDRLKETILYLDRVRFSNSYEESVSSAAAGGFVQLDYFLSHEDDFILNTNAIGAPAECSWLKPGTVFSGHQQTIQNSSPTMLSHRLSVPNRVAVPTFINGSDSNRITVYTSSGRRYWANSGDVGRGATEDFSTAKSEHWPVKVTIHDVDYNSMTLSGTMEAYNIPDETVPAAESAHIITFLEGEIIDFNTHTLETKNFNASPDIDSRYWRELEPFKDQSHDEIVKNLVSKKWLTETLAKGWILMRWKERCFVSPSNSRQGLTISGFYYITIRRDNGNITGMYYDPGSSPYQQLTLEPIMKDKMVFPSYGFR